MAGGAVSGWSRFAGRAGLARAALALLALLPGCYINLDGLSGGAVDEPDDPKPSEQHGSCDPADCGGGPCVVASGEAAGAPAAIAATGPFVVWTSRADNRIRRLDPKTDEVSDLVGFTQTPGLLAAGNWLVVWVADDGLWQCPAEGCAGGAISLLTFAPGEADLVRGVATDGRAVYWTRDEPSGSAGELLRCSVTAGCGAAPELLAPSQSHPRGVAVAPGETGNVVWIEQGTGPAFGRVLGLDKGATSAVMPTQVATLLDFPERVALGGSDVVWTWSDPEAMASGVSRCDFGASCAVEDFAPQIEPARPLRDPAEIVVHGADAYWANRGGGTVMRCPTAGCSGYPAVLAEGLTNPSGVAVQGDCVYAIDEADGGRIIRVPR